MARRLLLACVVLVSTLGLSASNVSGAPLRYQDQVFSSVTKVADIAYGQAVDQEGLTQILRLDLYRPTGDTATRRPLAIFVHGGGFSRGDKTARHIVDQATVFAQRGYVTASINYRLSNRGCSDGPSPECQAAIVQAREDAQAAVAFLRSRATTFGIDPTRVAMAGSSAGAITAVNVAFSSASTPASSVRAAASLSGASRLTPANPGDAPILLLHGTADPVVPYRWAQDTVTKATSSTIPAVLVSWAGAGHVPYAEHRGEILERTGNFFYAHLDLAHATG
jgi:dipeptidyl aminopeptidase/acylaminoacyl peptidase